MTAGTGREPATPCAGPGRRFAAALGAALCAIAVGLGAYAAHAASDTARTRLDTAVLYLFLHGLALAVFALRQRGWLSAASLILWIAGCAGFCGSLVAAALWGAPTMFAPVGGIAFMLGWLLQAVVLGRAPAR